MNYRQMVEDIDKIVQGTLDEPDQFCEYMEIKSMPHSTPYTQEEALKMARKLAEVYAISHAIYCEACGKKYLEKDEIMTKKGRAHVSR